MAFDRTFHKGFWSISALFFVISAVITVALSLFMSAMGGMPMTGGWTMSVIWMRMPGQTWFDAAATFLGMWVIMMAAMMLPSLVPMLLRYRRTIDKKGKAHLDRLTLLVGTGYFFVWTLFGLAAYLLGAVLAEIEMRLPMLAHAVPVAVGMVVLIAGAFQFTTWKAHHLSCCRKAPIHGSTLPASARTAWQYGLYLGLHCSYCCVNLMMILFVFGIMDLRAMAVVMAAITIERLVPARDRTARAIGVVAMGAGLFMVVQAAMSG